MTDNRDDTQSPPHSPPFSRPELSDSDRRNWAMAAHLSALVAFLGVPSVVGPLAVWLVKKDEDPFIAEHSANALNFNISVLIYTVVAAIATVIVGLATFGFGLLIAVPVLMIAFVAWLVFVVQAGMAASRGESYKYPWTFDFVK